MASRPSHEGSDDGDLYVVESCRAINGDAVWVKWMGYPKQRSCWRSLSTHFLGLGGTPSESQSRVRMSVQLLESDPTQEVLHGRPPLGKDIKSAPTARGSRSTDDAGQAASMPAAKRGRKRAYESKVHTIHVGETGIQEVRGIKRAGMPNARAPLKGDPSATVDHQDSSTSETNGGATSRAHSLGGEGGDNHDVARACDDGSAAGESSAPGAVRLRTDEQSELWATHRVLNEAAWQRPEGFMLRVEVVSTDDSQVTVRWLFPGFSPGDASAWIGLWDASEFDWPRGEVRPRYLRYKALTSSKHEGTVRFGSKEWVGLEDGDYCFSIDTGSLPFGSGNSCTYCVSQRLRVVDECVVGVIGSAHGSPLPPTVNQIALPRRHAGASSSGLKPSTHGTDSDSNSDGSDEEAEQHYMFAVPLLEYDIPEENSEIKRVYALVDRLSYLDWGLRSEDEVTGKRAPRMATQMTELSEAGSKGSFGGSVVHDGAIWGEAAHGKGNVDGPRTARTSEGYGEATLATAERLVRLLSKLTMVVPAMGGWFGNWNLDGDATFLDIGSGYGKVNFHAKLLTGCRCSVGLECVSKRVEISTTSLQGLYAELDRTRLDNDLLRGVAFESIDATTLDSFPYSHIYIFDRVFSEVTLAALAKVLSRSPFYVMISSKAPRVWWGVGLAKVQPVARMRFVTTGKERCTAYVYINSQYIPGTVQQQF